MVWLAILGLFVWLIVEHNRANAFATELARLQRLAGSYPPQPIAPPRVEPVPPPARPVPPPAAATVALPARAAPALVRPPAPPITRGAIEAWLSERGLAWIGGSALVIGAAFLVGYAVHKGVFTPAMRIGAAALLGLVLIGAGEAIRRGRLAGFGGHKLAAGVCAGAGAAILYGTTWAAYGLYHFIPAPVCGGLLAVIAAGLMGLAIINGEALAVLALGGAFAVPLIAGGGSWSIETTTAYLGILIAAGASVSWLRRWPAAAWANIVGVLLWALAATAQGASWKALLLGLEPLAVTATLAWLRPRALGVSVGLGVTLAASTAVMFALLAADSGALPIYERMLAGLGFLEPKAIAESLAAAVALPWLTATLVRRGAAPAWALIAPAVALAVPVYFVSTMLIPPRAALGLPTSCLVWAGQIVALSAAGWWARGSRDGAASAVAASLGGLLIGLAGSVAWGAGSLAALAPATACACGAVMAALAARNRREDALANEHEVIAGVAAAGLTAALAAGLDWRWGPFGFAAAAVGLAALARRLGWRSPAVAAAVSAGIGAAALLTPDMLGYALQGGAAGAAWVLIAGLFVGAASFVAARILASDRWAAEALRTISPIAALAGTFLALHWAAAARTGLPLDDLSEAAIRTVLIAGAGLTGLAGLRREREPAPFARWRAHGLLAIAAVHAGLVQGLLLNPRLTGEPAGGLVLLNTLAAAYLAPAVLFAAAAARSYRQSPLAGRIYALVAAGFAVVWALLEARSLTYGPHMDGDALTVHAPEALAGAVALIGIVALVDWLKTASGYVRHPFALDAERSMGPARIIAVVYAGLVPGLWANPWFGPAAAPLHGPYAAVGMLAGYALLVLLFARLARDAHRAGKTGEAAFTTRVAIALGLLAASLAVRAGFHPIDLRWTAGTSEVESWTYSAVWAAIGLGFIGLSRIGGRIFLRAGLVVLMITTAKVFIIDTASLSGVVRAGSFLALGALLLMGALTARRIGRGAVASDATPGGA